MEKYFINVLKTFFSINRQLYAYSSLCLFSVLIYVRTQYERYVSMIDALKDVIGSIPSYVIQQPDHDQSFNIS
jgi:hypothetical protein